MGAEFVSFLIKFRRLSPRLFNDELFQKLRRKGEVPDDFLNAWSMSDLKAGRHINTIYRLLLIALHNKISVCV